MQRTPTKTPSRTPTRTPTKGGTKIPTPNRTPTKIPTPRKSIQNCQITSDLNHIAQAEGSCCFSEVNTKRLARSLFMQGKGIRTFQGLRNFPSVRCIDMSDNPGKFTKMAVLVAFRSLYVKSINGEEVTHDEIVASFDYSALVTFALRQGMRPNISEDPHEALMSTLQYLEQGVPGLTSQNNWQDSLYKRNGDSVTIKAKGSLYTWYVLDDEFLWKQISESESDNVTIKSSFNFPLRCEVKNAIVKVNNENVHVKSLSIYIPEFDEKYHVYAEILGDIAEGRLISVKAPLNADIEWRHADDDSLMNSQTLVLPLYPNDVDRVIACDITPAKDFPKTRLLTPPVKPGEFRFRSLRLQGELVEDDEIEFEVSTKGTKAKFIGIRVLRSARHGDWEHIDFISAPDEPDTRLSYRLTVHDIGCVIRAVCITEGGGPPLMLTSNERVQPSPPSFKEANIYGSLSVGMPLFAVAEYHGGLQGNCRYEWSIGGSSARPVIVPTEADVGKTVTCLMTPIRSDGSIGQTVEASLPKPIQDGKALQERFLVYKKKTSAGRLQFSFTDERPSENLFILHEGETIIIKEACDWAVVTQHGISPAGHSKMFTADSESIKGIVVVFSNDFFAIVGQIEASQPTANDLQIVCDNASAFLTVDYHYTGGTEGRSIIQWNRNDGIRETVVGFGKSLHVSLADRGCTYKAIVTPQSLDGKCGVPTSSPAFLIDDSSLINEERPKIEIDPPQTTLQDCEIKIVTKGDETPNPKEISYAFVSEPIPKRYKVAWICDNAEIAEGLSFRPTLKHVGKHLSIEIQDRIRNTVVADCDLPPVEPQTASVSNIKFLFTPLNDLKQVIKIQRDFKGGTEGSSKIEWFIYETETGGKPISKIETTQLELTADDSVEGYYICVNYHAKNTKQSDYSAPVESDRVKIPIHHPPGIEIRDASIVPSKDYKQLICKVETHNEGRVEYEWGYFVKEEEKPPAKEKANKKKTKKNERSPTSEKTNSPKEEKQEIIKKFPTGEKTNKHKIKLRDFESQIYCHIYAYGYNDKLCDEADVFLDPDLYTWFTPVILYAEVQPKASKANDKLSGTTTLKQTLSKTSKTPTKTPERGSEISSEMSSEISSEKSEEKTIIVGQEIETVIINYKGPAFTNKYVDWERFENGEWKKISEEEVYIPTSADAGHKIRASFDVSATHHLLEEPVYSERYQTEGVLVTRSNPTISRMASALYRTRKAMFDAKLSMGEKVTILLENGMFLMKGGASVLLRAQYKSIQVEIIESTLDTLALRARHGYNTELTFSEKKMNGGTKFNTTQTRELFIETLNLFKQKG